jgi:hypothetical protein
MSALLENRMPAPKVADSLVRDLEPAARVVDRVDTHAKEGGHIIHVRHPAADLDAVLREAADDRGRCGRSRMMNTPISELRTQG